MDLADLEAEAKEQIDAYDERFVSLFAQNLCHSLAGEALENEIDLSAR